MPGQKLLVIVSMAVFLSLIVFTTVRNAPSQSKNESIHGAYHELHNGHHHRSLQQNTTQNITNSTQTMVKHKGKSNKPFFFDGVYYESSEAFGATGKICGTKGLPAHLRAKIQKEVEKYMMQKFGPYDPTDPYGVYSPNNPNNTNVTTDQNGTNGTNSTDISQGANSTENTNGSNGTEAANITQGIPSPGQRGRLLQTDQEIFINTYVHVVYRTSSTDPTNVSTEMIKKQLKVVNDAFSGLSSEYTDCSGRKAKGFVTPFRFKLVTITRTLDNSWHMSSDTLAMATKLRRGTCSDLNIFIHTPSYGRLGVSSFPSECDNLNLFADFVSLHWASLPDASWSPFNQGDTLVHEIGHWLGLQHTFDGGCSATGDSVADTPAERSPARGCPVALDTCTDSDGLDPVTNYMDYTDDCCMYTFTNGQVIRMLQQSMTYRALDYTSSPTPDPAPPSPTAIVVPIASPTTPPTLDDVLYKSGPNTCQNGQMMVQVTLKTDAHPEETSWDVYDASTRKIIFSYQVDASYKFASIIASLCLNRSKYYFLVVNDSGGNGMNSGASGFWKFSLNGVVQGSGSDFKYHDGFQIFGAWPKCFNSNKRLITLILHTDDNGTESSWSIQDKVTGEIMFRNTITFRSNAIFVQNRCVPINKSLVFRLRDSGRNGLCCGYGQGFFAMHYNGKQILKGETFVGSRSKTVAT